MLLRLVEVVRRPCIRPEARNTLRYGLVVWSTAVLTYISVCTSFSHCYIYSSVRLYALFSPHCRRRRCGPVDVASMSGALIGGAHENMP